MNDAERALALGVLASRLIVMFRRDADYPKVYDNWELTPHLKTLEELA